MTQTEVPTFTTQLEELLATTALETGLSVEQLKSKSRRARYVRARSFFAARAREHGYNLVDIGEALNRSHCAVMNYLKPSGAITPEIPDTTKGEQMTTKKVPLEERLDKLTPDERRDLVTILSKTAVTKEERAALAAMFRDQDGGNTPRVETPAAPATTPEKKPKFWEDL